MLQHCWRVYRRQARHASSGPMSLVSFSGCLLPALLSACSGGWTVWWRGVSLVSAAGFLEGLRRRERRRRTLAAVYLWMEPSLTICVNTCISFFKFGQSFEEESWGPWQLPHLRCSAWQASVLCDSEYRRHTAEFEQTALTWPILQQFWHWSDLDTNSHPVCWKWQNLACDGSMSLVKTKLTDRELTRRRACNMISCSVTTWLYDRTYILRNAILWIHQI